MDFQEILRLVRWMCRPPLDCENIAAEIILEHLTNGQPITKIAIKNRCRDAMRKLRYEKHHLGLYSQIDPEFTVPLDDEQLRNLIRDTSLDDKERKVILFYYLGEMTLQQVAHLTQSTVRQTSDLQWSAVEKLKQKARELYG